MMPHKNGSRRPKAVPVNKVPPLEDIFRDRRILITGGTGFLGKVLLSILLRHHPEIGRIYLLVRGDRRSSLVRYQREILASPPLGPLRENRAADFDRYMIEKVAIVPGDITEPGLISDDAITLERGSIDAVIHCAGLVNFEASLEKAIGINTIGAHNVIEFCRKQGAALIHVSTCYTAGVADGQRFEDDLPTDWCPNGRRNFNVQREIQDALAAIERVEAESHDLARQEEFRAAAGDQNADDGANDPGDRAVESRRKQWLEERLKQIGKERAQGWGWPNTYSYTKSLGEQLVLAARATIAATIVRPSVIESALCDPEPGWNQGVNTSGPLTYLTGRGFRFVPATGPLVLDVIPVDLVAHAMVPILAALLINRQQPVYQLGTSDVNPLPMRRLVELTGLSNRREHRLHGGPMGKLAPHLDATVASPTTYQTVTSGIPAILKRGAKLARTMLGDDSVYARKFEDQAEKIGKSALMVRSLAEVYRPYTEDLLYTFHGKNIRDLYAALASDDADRHPYHPERIDWFDYWTKVHMPGLRRNIYPQLEMHTRGRPSGSFRYKTLVEMLDRMAERCGARVALESLTPSGERTSISYRELRERAHRASLLLAARGIKPGDRVVLIAENSPEWVVAYFAIVYAGAVAVPVADRISPEELDAIARIAEPRLALLSAGSSKRRGRTFREAAGGIAEMEISDLQKPFALRGHPAELIKIERKTVASTMFTAGTTGEPKGVMLTHGNFTAQIAALGPVFALGADDVTLSLLPLHHAFEFTCGLLLPLASGARIVYPPDTNAASLWRNLIEVQPTALIGIPALWESIHRRIVEQVEARGPFAHAAFDRLRDLNRRIDGNHRMNLGATLFGAARAALGGRLKLAVSGDAALTPRVAQFFGDIGITLLQGYGLTEGGSMLSITSPEESSMPCSVGKPLPKVELKLVSVDGDRQQGQDETQEQLEARAGEVGEIVARGPSVMSGYFKDQAATDQVLKNGWLHTGDLGRFDHEGRLHMAGRAKDVVVDSVGKRTYLDEVEEAYRESPYVRELAVVASKIGENKEIAALAVPEYAKGKSRRAVEDKLRAHFESVSSGLEAHKRISLLRFTDTELPRTRTRKVKRIALAATLCRMIEGIDAARGATKLEVEPWLVAALERLTGRTSKISPAMRLADDLGLDPIALAELTEQISIRAGRDLSAEELGRVATVEDLQCILSEGQARPELASYGNFAQPYTIELPAPIRRMSEFAIRKTLGFALDSWLKPVVMGRGNIPANRNFIVVANQASHLDFALVNNALGASSRDLVVLAAKDYFFNTNARRFASTNLARLIPFDRDTPQIESLEQAVRELAAGRSVLIFPEGTRSPDGKIHEFKSGAGYLAMHSRCDVLPIHLKGTFAVLGKGQLLPRRAQVEVRIGRVMTNAELRLIANEAEGADAFRKLADYMRQAIVDLEHGSSRSTRATSIKAPSLISSESASHEEDVQTDHGRTRHTGNPAKS